jgi:hypothetical protein
MEAGVVVRLGTGFVLLLAFCAKVRNPTAFRNALDGFALLPGRLVRPVSLVVLATEAVLGALLIAGLFQRAALVAGSGLFALFAIAIALASKRNGAIACGCLGTGVTLRTGPASAIVNGVAAVTSLLAVAASPGYGADTSPSQLATGQGIILLLIGTLVAGVYWVAMYALSVLRLVEEAITEGVVR